MEIVALMLGFATGVGFGLIFSYRSVHGMSDDKLVDIMIERRRMRYLSNRAEDEVRREVRKKMASVGGGDTKE